MANPEVRCFYIYADDEKLGEVMSSTYDLDFGRSPMHVVDGIYYSKGQILTALSFEEAVPIQGTRKGKLADALQQKNVQIAIPVDGSVLLQEMVYLKAQFKGEVEKGTCTGSWTLGGGAPTQQTV